jgi:hypothetical protein
VVKRIFAVVLMGALAIGAAGAQEEQPPTLKLTPALDTAQAQELLQRFESLCIEKFPDEAAVVAAVESEGAVQLPEDEIRGVLGGPGRGWALKGKTATFYLTLKAEPDRHCAVRSYANALFAPADWRIQLGNLLAAKKQVMEKAFDYDQPHANGGVSHAFVNVVFAVGPLENYTMIVEDFPAAALRKSETRLVRRIMSLPSAR